MPSKATEDTTMTNGMDPAKMSGEERVAEVSTLLSLAMMRLWLKRRRAVGQDASKERAILGEYSLGLDAESRPHVTAGKP